MIAIVGILLGCLIVSALIIVRQRREIEALDFEIRKDTDYLTPEEIGCKVVPSDQVHVHGGYNSRDFLMMIHAQNADTKERLQELVELGNPFAKKKLDEIENEEKKQQQPKHID